MGRSSNDDRSDRYNPTSGSYWAAEANEASQRDDDSGDDSYEDDIPAFAVRANAATFKVEVAYPRDDAPPTLQQMWAPFILDRQSTFLHAIGMLLHLSSDHRFETPASLQARTAVMSGIESTLRAAESDPLCALSEKERQNSYPP